MDRFDWALGAVDLTGRGLEIGPSYNPLVPKSTYPRVQTVDHATREELVAKYEGYGLPQEKLDAIEVVDHVWPGGSLLDVVPDPGTFDYVVASHLIEHTVDLVAFLTDCEGLLAVGGRLALVVPDKRFCFDRFRPLSTLGDVLEAHHSSARFHSAGTLADHVAYASCHRSAVAWAGGVADADLELQFEDLDGVAEAVRHGLAQDEYRDSHHWMFTPSSLTLLVEDLRRLGLHDLSIVASHGTEGFEFFLTLQKGGPAPSGAPSRLERLRTVEEELATPLTRPLLQTIEELRAQLRDQSARVSDLDGKVAAGRQGTALALEAVRAFEQSTSWRVTRPLRALSSRLLRR